MVKTDKFLITSNRSKQIYYLDMYLYVVQVMSVFSRLFSDVFNACAKLHKFSSFKKGMQAVITDSNCGIVPKFQFFLINI